MNDKDLNLFDFSDEYDAREDARQLDKENSELRAEIAILQSQLNAIFDAWREVGAEDGFIVTSDCLKLYHAIKPFIPEIKKHA